MERKRLLRWLVLLLIAASVVLTACGGGQSDATPETSAPVAADDGGSADEAESDEEETVATEAPEATLTPQEQIPDVLVVHPEAFDFQITAASNTYVYIVPGMVAETTEYMETELLAKGWEELGKPTIMGHLATLNLQMGKSRLTISMQDNERTETTRVQMVFFEQ